MAYVSNWSQVQQLLSERRARKIKVTAYGDIYLDAYGKYLRVARNGAGFQVDTFGSLAECNCG